MKAFGMELRRDYAAIAETYSNDSENCQSRVLLSNFDGYWFCAADVDCLDVARGKAKTADEAIANCEAAARRNHAALAELLDRMK